MDKIERLVGNMLIEMGADPSLKGFSCVIDGVSILIENGSVPAIQVYTAIAEKHGTDFRCVERNIRHVFSKLDKHCKTYNEIFGDIKRSAFSCLSILAWKLKERLEDNNEN